MSAPRPVGRIFAIHGAAPNAERRRFLYRSIAHPRTLERFLDAGPPFVPLADALAGVGDALTIDDATRGSADAALLARARGYAVTLFVNPGQVISGAPYWFVALNTLIDRLDGTPYVFEDRSFPTATFNERYDLRQAVKARLSTMKDEPERLALVRQLADEWHAAPLEVPAHFVTLNRDDLVRLRDAGVDIQNHGWLHTHHGCLSPTESAREVRRGREWLRYELGIDAAFFAVPDGHLRPAEGADADCALWLTAHEAWPAGYLSPKVFNRTGLDLVGDRWLPVRTGRQPSFLARSIDRLLGRRII